MKYAPYSFSKITTFIECQKKFDFSYVNKITIDREYIDPSYFIKGRFLHSYIANRLKGGDGLDIGSYNIDENEKMNLVDIAENTLIHEYVNFTYDFDCNLIEKQIFLGSKLEPVKIKKEAAFVGYIDYIAFKEDLGIIIDWKTGKYNKNPNFSQLELYAIWLFQHQVKLTEIDLIFFYVEHNALVNKTVTREDVEEMKNELTNAIDIIEHTKEFEINESKRCLRCQFYNTCIKEFGIKIS
jgi:CRISPR/Cas system-associated exonuclease Cas4 (RecB family)